MSLFRKDPPKPQPVSDEARYLQASIGRNWVGGMKRDELIFIDTCLKTCREYLSRLKALKQRLEEKSDPTNPPKDLKLVRHLWDIRPAATAFAEQVLIRVHARTDSGEAIYGSLKNYAPKLSSDAFWKMFRVWCSTWNDDEVQWDRVEGLLKSSEVSNAR